METMNMNIDTLLEAAIFLENRSGSQGPSNAKARAKTASFHPYAKAPPPAADGMDTSEGDNGDTMTNYSLSPTEEGKERRRAGGAGTREVHNKLEKNRRAHLKECFEQLKRQIPSLDDKRTSNLSILRCSLRYIQMLKRKEKEFEQEMQQLAKQKIQAQERITSLKRELAAMNIEVDINSIVSAVPDDETASDSTATADNESPIVSEAEGDDQDEDDAPPTEAPPLSSGVPASNNTATDVKPHVPVTATLPTLQPPVPSIAPKQLAVNATTPIVIAPLNQPVSHAVLAMPSARALSNVSKVMTASNQPIVALPAGTTTMSLATGMMTGTVLSTMPGSPATNTIAQPVLAASNPQPASATTVATPTTATPTFKTPVAQILQQTIAQRALAQHIQQHQARIQQQQHQHQQQLPAQNATQQAPKVITVQGSALRHSLKPLTQLRQAVTVNHFVPSLLTPGASILASPATLTPTQLGSVTAVAKAPVLATPTSTHNVPSTATAMAVTTSTPQAMSSCGGVSPAVTFTTMKQLIAPQQLPAHIMSLSGSQMSAIGQLMSQAAAPRAANPTAQAAAAGQQASAMTLSAIPQGITTSSAGPTIGSAAHPVMTSLTHMTPMTQMVTPLSMVSPAMQMSPATLSPALSMVNSPILRSLGHIPIQLQQPFNLGQIVKPVVMVSMPNVAQTTSSTATTVQVQLPVTHPS